MKSKSFYSRKLSITVGPYRELTPLSKLLSHPSPFKFGSAHNKSQTILFSFV